MLKRILVLCAVIFPLTNIAHASSGSFELLNFLIPINLAPFVILPIVYVILKSFLKAEPDQNTKIWRNIFIVAVVIDLIFFSLRFFVSEVWPVYFSGIPALLIIFLVYLGVRRHRKYNSSNFFNNTFFSVFTSLFLIFSAYSIFLVLQMSGLLCISIPLIPYKYGGGTDGCYMQKAIRNEDKDICLKIDSETSRDYCYKDMERRRENK
ncbi:MAG: hypothetical protein NTV72_02115 [Candidatus Taylorbacteria bacterium]|nr:hypothetical protein [Candidatus Taylorbacteria bacterium]